MKELVLGKTVSILADSTQSDKDTYGRLLRYVWTADGTSINKILLTEGYAYEYTFKLPYKYQNSFRNAQEQAKLLHKGLWAKNTCNGVSL
jgi:micrococcal nuclease